MQAPDATTQGSKVQYTCGQCGVDLNLKLNDTVQCTECGGRILYKKRTRNIVQFEAR
jgi:DNA-directed RNA polymerases I, II, and III subunit RPABC4